MSAVPTIVVPLSASALSARFALSAFVALSACFALSALPAVLACFTERPGARALIWFLAMFLACFFSFLFKMLLIAVGAAIAVPANATTRATIATIIAGDGRRPFELVIKTPLLVVG